MCCVCFFCFFSIVHKATRRRGFTCRLFWVARCKVFGTFRKTAARRCFMCGLFCEYVFCVFRHSSRNSGSPHVFDILCGFLSVFLHGSQNSDSPRFYVLFSLSISHLGFRRLSQNNGSPVFHVLKLLCVFFLFFSIVHKATLRRGFRCRLFRVGLF